MADYSSSRAMWLPMKDRLVLIALAAVGFTLALWAGGLVAALAGPSIAFAVDLRLGALGAAMSATAYEYEIMKDSPTIYWRLDA